LLQGGKASSVLLTEIQIRCFHVSPLAAAASKVAMSKFDKDGLPYDKLVKNLEIVKKRLNRPLTLSEKVLYSHLYEPETQVIDPLYDADFGGYDLLITRELITPTFPLGICK
jgi:hypothetical protein